MLDIDRLIAECEAAVVSGGGEKQVHDIVARAVSDPAAAMAALGEPTGPGLNILHRSRRLTVINLVWGPNALTRPHEHRMWAVIGMYTGREDNIFWRRLPETEGSRVEAAGARALMPGQACPLGRDIVHSVLNPLSRLTGALHVYGGDFIEAERSEWNDETLREQPFDYATARARVEASKEAWANHLRTQKGL